MISYEQAIRCPRCGKDSDARAEQLPGSEKRLVACACLDKQCSRYGRTWYLSIDADNTVIGHTHTPYSEPT